MFKKYLMHKIFLGKTIIGHTVYCILDGGEWPQLLTLLSRLPTFK